MIILWFPFFTTLFWPVICTCPPEEDIAPHCICKDLGDGPMMLCNNVMSTDELFPLIKSTDSYDMFALTLMNSALSYIPSDLFKGTQYQKIRFVNTQIMSLSDDDLAFVGLEDRLEELRATDAHYVTQWDWSQLRNHRRLDLIDINLISMHSLDQEFPALKSLTALGLIKAEISFIHPTAFSKLENLQILDMRDNLITEVSRSLLPNPAHRLRLMDFSGNQLTSLPENMFDGMPNLKELELNFNKFKTLNEETFLWPFEHLQLLQFKGNEFLCDCRLKWLVKVGKPFYFQGSCSLPENLNGMSLKDISEKMLRC
ncbi:slit homolog 1 protein-like [Argiope bruennichi]|uniref:slit homolog 1 protein-like n=1 Tax=Argiope bruennichi TaxID=94029 RepID=UPI002493F229|nr:slit homolog 1 protein-like [Argiope bruennichi]